MQILWLEKKMWVTSCNELCSSLKISSRRLYAADFVCLFPQRAKTGLAWLLRHIKACFSRLKPWSDDVWRDPVLPKPLYILPKGVCILKLPTLVNMCERTVRFSEICAYLRTCYESGKRLRYNAWLCLFSFFLSSYTKTLPSFSKKE
jgi:hypothetical protein